MAEGKERQGFTKDMLTGEVREVADELQGNIADFFKDRGVANADALGQSLRSGALSSADIVPVRENIRMLQHIMRTGEIPKGLQEQRRTKDAERIFGDDFLGPDAVEKTFGVRLAPEDVPQVPFSREEMERAKAMDQMLILRIDQASDGSPLTMEKMQELKQSQFEAEGKGKILFSVDWYGSEDFYTQDIPTGRWAFVSKDVIPGSTNKNYLDQTQTLADYLRTDVFQGSIVPSEYQEALEEFEREKTEIAPIISSDWQQATERLSNLKLNQLTRRKSVEVMYDLIMRVENNDERLLQGKYDWTISRSSSGSLVRVGDFDADGARVSGWDPGNVYSDLGVVLSRS